LQLGIVWAAKNGLDSDSDAIYDSGDGTVGAGVVDQAAGVVLGDHVYEDNGNYSVSVAVFEDDGGGGIDTLTVAVNNVVPVAISPTRSTADHL